MFRNKTLVQTGQVTTVLNRMSNWPLHYIFFSLIIFSLPYLLLAILSPEGQLFNWTLWNFQDTTQFYSAFAQGKNGGFLYANQFTAENTTDALGYTTYFILGWLSAPLNLGPEIATHIGRLAGAILVLVGTWRLAGLYFKDEARAERLKRLAAVLSLFGVGPGIFIVPLLVIFGVAMSSVFWLILTFTTPFYILFAPHYSLSIGLFLLFIDKLAKNEDKSNQSDFALLKAALYLLAAGIMNPSAITVGIVCAGVYYGVRFLGSRNWQYILRGAAVITPSLPLVAYFGLVLAYFPGWNHPQFRENVSDNFSFFSLLLMLGVPFWFALYEVIAKGLEVWRGKKWQGSAVYWIAYTWFVTNLLLLFLPFWQSGRYLCGFYSACILPGISGLERFLNHFFADKIKRRAVWQRRILFFCLLPALLDMTVITMLNLAAPNETSNFLPKDWQTSLQWLGQNSGKDDVILSTPDFGLYVPYFTHAHTIASHYHRSIDYPGKLQGISTFYDPTAALPPKLAFLNHEHVTYAIGLDSEVKLDPRLSANFSPVFSSGEVKVYRYKPDSARG